MTLPYRLIGLLFLCLSSSLQAEDITYAGAWSGFVGKHPIMACLKYFDGSYYYLKHLKGIRLKAPEKNSTDNVWTEQSESFETTGTWTIEQYDHKTITGVWHSPDGKAQQKIRLKKLAAECDMNFLGPIASRFSDKIRIGYPKNPSKTVKDYLGKREAEEIASAYDCDLQDKGGDGYESELDVSLDTSQFLVLRSLVFDTRCGRGYWSYEVLNPKTAKAIDTWRWINGGEKSISHDPPTRLRKLIVRLDPALKDNDGCTAEGMDINRPLPAPQGLRFVTDHGGYGRACNSEVLLTYKQLQPYLTPQGKAVAAYFEAATQ